MLSRRRERCADEARRPGVIRRVWAIALASVACLAFAGCGGGDRARTLPTTPVRGAGLSSARADTTHPLELTEWRLVSFRTPGHPLVAVTTSARFRLDGQGHASADGCNAIRGRYEIRGQAILFGKAGTTLVLCTGERGRIDHAMLDLLSGTARWAIADGRLTLRSHAGADLVFRRAASAFPDAPGAAVILAGRHAHGRYRLTAQRHGAIWGATYSFFTAPGTQPGDAGIASDDIGCLANSVTQAAWPDGKTYVFGWVTPEVSRVVSQGVKLTFYLVPHTKLRIAAGWVPGFRPSHTAITWYDASSAVLAQYPHGPC